MIFPKRDSSTEKELSSLTSAVASSSTLTSGTSSMTSAAVPKLTEPTKTSSSASFARQTSKSEVKLNDLNSVVADKASSDASVEKPVATPPSVEKSYLHLTEKPTLTGANIEATRPTLPSPTKAAPGVEPASKTSSPAHFVGGWKVPSPTKEISREDRKTLSDDTEDLPLLERVRLSSLYYKCTTLWLSIVRACLSKKTIEVY